MKITTAEQLRKALVGRKIVDVTSEAYEADESVGADAGVSVDVLVLDNGARVVLGVVELCGDYAIEADVWRPDPVAVPPKPKRERRKRGECRECGFPLVRTDRAMRCPRCGWTSRGAS